ncbi:MAG: hypothetical protein CL878_11605 [Dehalococcoidia bacterium]|nr:hypothetical protein [Dehalococcoidia bacterium]
MESTTSPSIPNYGGQAVIEGVMMRSRRAMAVAVRHPAGHTVVHVEPLRSARHRSRWARLPLIRGMVLLWDTLVLGMRALAFSANVAAEEDLETDGDPSAETPEEPQAPSEAFDTPQEEPAAMPQGVLWGTMIFAFAIGIGLFFVVPLLLVRTVDPLISWSVASNLLEGLVRLALFLGYVTLIGLLADVRRVFAYHGAEHKTINAFEAGVPLERERVTEYGTLHPRCGTSFLLVVVVLSIAVFSLLGRPELPVRLASRVLLVPVIAGVSYELLRFTAARRHLAPIRAVMAPGLLLQRLTTREPDASQVEVAIEALRRLLTYEADHPTAAPASPAASAAPG